MDATATMMRIDLRIDPVSNDQEWEQRRSHPPSDNPNPEVSSLPYFHVFGSHTRIHTAR